LLAAITAPQSIERVPSGRWPCENGRSRKLGKGRRCSAGSNRSL
jgi:hypothetical protein